MIEKKILCVEDWHTKIPALKELTESIVEEYILEIKKWKEQQYETKFSSKLYEAERTRKVC